MNAEELFKNIREVRGELYYLERREDYLTQSMLPGAIQYDKDSVQSSPSDPMAKYAERISDIEDVRRERIKKLTEDSYLVQRILQEMPTALYRLLLELRYIEGDLTHRYSWMEVATEIGYDEQYTRWDLHHAAIEEAQKVCDEICGNENIQQKPTNECDIV